MRYTNAIWSPLLYFFSWGKCKRCAVLVNDPQHALFLCLAGPSPFWARVLSFLTIFQGDVYLGSTMHCYDILSGGASLVTGYSDLKKARKVALASFSMPLQSRL